MYNEIKVKQQSAKKMIRQIEVTVMLLMIVGSPQVIQAQPVIADSAGIIVGAIRWDWTGGGTVTEAVEKSLGPKQWHHRVPFFGEIINDSTIKASCATQECVDQEILYAKENGLDYWAFLLYPPGSDLDLPLRRYLSSGYNPVLKFSVIGDQPVDRIISYFKHPSYQTVLDGRPLYYILFGETEPNHIADLRAACAAEGIPDPYVVPMKDQQDPGEDAITRYWYSGMTFGGETYGAPYSTLATSAVAFWNQQKDAGYAQVPLVSAGTDGRPRIENTPPWIPDPSFYAKYFEPPTPGELADNLQNAVNFVAANPSSCEAKAILMYAWNENDEGGWLTPTLDTSDRSLIDDSRLRAIKEVVWPTDPSDPRSKDASLGAILVNGDSLPDFHPDTFSYHVNIDAGSSNIPVITALSNEKYARVQVTSPDLIERDAFIAVTSEDGSVKRNYSLSFNINYVPPDSIGWEFNTPLNTEGWLSQWTGHANITVEDTTLLVNVTDTYPEIKSATSLRINAATYNKLTISMKNKTISDDWYFRFFLPDGTEKTMDFIPSTMDTEFHEYHFDLGAVPEWQGTIDQVRWLMARFTGTGSAEFDYMRFYLTDDPLSDDATLSLLEVDGDPVEDFMPDQEIYLDTLPAGTLIAPVVSAVASHPGATVNIIQAVQPDDMATIQVISQSGLFSKTYSIDFEVPIIPRTPYYYTDFSEGTLPDGWEPSKPGYNASVENQVFELEISKTSAGDHYTFGNLFVEDFDMRPYMTLSYRSPDTLLVGVRIIGPLESSSTQEVFALPASEEWTNYTFNLSSLATESWGYDLDSIQLVFQPGSSVYSGTFSMNEVMIADTVNGKTFRISLDQPPPFSVDLGNDTTIVAPADLVLDAGNPGKYFLWNTGETTQTILVDTTGIYHVTVIGANNCTHSDTIAVTLEIEDDIQEMPALSGPILYPNPSQGNFRLELGNSQELKRVELILISASGKVLYHNILKNVPAGATEEIEMKDAALGIYLLKVVCDGVPSLRNVAIY